MGEAAANERCLRCKWYFLPPIYLCPKWHNLCNRCKKPPKYKYNFGSQVPDPRIVKEVFLTTYFCFKCIKFYPRYEDQQNLELQQRVAISNFPCVYHEEGCEFVGPYTEMVNHSKICDFVYVTCAFPNCKNVHMLKEYKNHLVEAHELLTIDEPEVLKSRRVYALIVDDDFFLMTCRQGQHGYDIWVGYFGPSYKYTFQIFIGTKDKSYLKSYDFLPHAEFLVNNDRIPLRDYDMFSFPYAYLMHHVDPLIISENVYFKVRAIENIEYEENPPERPLKIKRTCEGLGEITYYNMFKDAVPPPPNAP